MTKSYIVGVREVHYRFFSVVADDATHAKDLVRQRAEGVVDMEIEEYSHELATETWSVEEARDGHNQPEPAK